VGGAFALRGWRAEGLACHPERYAHPISRAGAATAMLSGIPDHAALLDAQRRYFASGATRSLDARKRALAALRRAIDAHEGALLAALADDLGKPALEAFTTEIGFLHLEIGHALRNLPRWLRPQRVRWDPFQFPGRAVIHRDPHGVALVIGPWNYPVQLLLAPMVAALAGGNTVIVKPSEHAPATEALLGRLIAETFDPAHGALIRGDAAMTRALLQQRFDKIFFTGSTAVGRKVMVAAAHHLTPVTLELGGKSPTIVAPDADVPTAARRIAWGKFINAGQTCIAPDFVAVHERHYERLATALALEIRLRFGDDPRSSPAFGRVIHAGHAQRLQGLLERQRVRIGGEIDVAARYVAPTLVEGPAWETPIMREEIFGPILPLIAYDREDDLLARLHALPKPLALYLFTNDRARHTRIRHALPSGGFVVNGTLQHVISPRLPFGGVGESGMGSYHGRAGFDAFTRPRSELRLPMRWPRGFSDARGQAPLSLARRLLR
jgi:aldehyde dehydrogenase (NAD+)